MPAISKQLISFDRYFFVVIVFIAVFIVFKVPVLSLPYFWDEAWSYMPAISQLFRNGISFMPGAIPADAYRGHPLLFYVMAASWMKLFGLSFISMHSFGLLITCITFFSIYLIGRNLFSPQTGIGAMLIFAMQPLVLGQSTFVLPEMLMSFWSLCCIFCVLRNTMLWYIFFGTCLLYTKESGIVLIGSLLCYQVIFEIIVFRRLFSGTLFKKLTCILVPVFIAAVYYFMQKWIMGWYFYPLHISMINYDWNEIQFKFSIYFNMFFTEEKRIFLTVPATILIALFGIQSGRKMDSEEKRAKFSFILSGILFMFFYLSFCACNFFANRYLLSILPVWSILITAPLVSLFRFYPIVLFYILGMITFLFYLENGNILIHPRNEISAEYNLGFKDAVTVQKQMCDYLQSGAYFDKKIYASYLFLVYLSNPDAGYLYQGNSFHKLMAQTPCNAEYVIYSSIEQEGKFVEYRDSCGFKLEKRFELGHSWAELYKKIQPEDVSK